MPHWKTAVSPTTLRECVVPLVSSNHFSASDVIFQLSKKVFFRYPSLLTSINSVITPSSIFNIQLCAGSEECRDEETLEYYEIGDRWNPNPCTMCECLDEGQLLSSSETKHIIVMNGVVTEFLDNTYHCQEIHSCY